MSHTGCSSEPRKDDANWRVCHDHQVTREEKNGSCGRDKGEMSQSNIDNETVCFHYWVERCPKVCLVITGAEE